MQKKSYNFTFILLLLFCLFTGVAAWRLYFKDYRQHDTIDIHHFPKTIDGWTSTDLTVTKDEYAILETHNVFVRKYTGPKGKEVYLMLVYSQHNRKVSHPPEICYTGSGATILKDHPVVISLPAQHMKFRVNKMYIERYGVHQISYYWYKIGNRFTLNYWKQQVLLAMNRLTDRSSSSALIRVTVTVGPDGEAVAAKRAKQFMAIVMPKIRQYLP